MIFDLVQREIDTDSIGTHHPFDGIAPRDTILDNLKDIEEEKNASPKQAEEVEAFSEYASPVDKIVKMEENN